MSLMGPLNLHCGAFMISTISCPALHELQDGALRRDCKLQKAQTCESGLTVYKVNSECCE